MKVVVRGACMSETKGIWHALEIELALQEIKLTSLQKALLIGNIGKAEWNAQCLKVGEIWYRLDKHNRSVGRSRWYREGDKSERLLARLIKTDQQPQPILELHNGYGTLVHTQQAINKIFASHLQKFYTDDQGETWEQVIHTYLQTIQLPRLAPEARAPLETLIT
ncbi:hypothetical protein NDU88_005574 [Pleurodeles waltl]|uniref:Uncharacterized protein n=1 Tax=Pleurodeles waltl TaxID=8319 RepID=A0AAV7MD93_PLEWA|nr:hypothetical protein NDU88_005574 [Pleurodeles waltl]